MIVAGWRKRFSVLGDAGVYVCNNCGNAARHLLVQERKEVKVYFIPIARFGKKQYVLCQICSYTTPCSPTEAERIVRREVLGEE